MPFLSSLLIHPRAAPLSLCAGTAGARRGLVGGDGGERLSAAPRSPPSPRAAPAPRAPQDRERDYRDRDRDRDRRARTAVLRAACAQPGGARTYGWGYVEGALPAQCVRPLGAARLLPGAGIATGIATGTATAIATAIATATAGALRPASVCGLRAAGLCAL